MWPRLRSTSPRHTAWTADGKAVSNRRRRVALRWRAKRASHQVAPPDKDTDECQPHSCLNSLSGVRPCRAHGACSRRKRRAAARGRRREGEHRAPSLSRSQPRTAALHTMWHPRSGRSGCPRPQTVPPRGRTRGRSRPHARPPPRQSRTRRNRNLAVHARRRPRVSQRAASIVRRIHQRPAASARRTHRRRSCTASRPQRGRSSTRLLPGPRDWQTGTEAPGRRGTAVPRALPGPSA